MLKYPQACKQITLGLIRLFFFVTLSPLLLSKAVLAESCTIAVAANFTHTAQKLKTKFEESHPHTIVISTGSTGQLFAQIINGAPFDVFMSADQERPRDLLRQGYTLSDKVMDFTQIDYAQGQLVLWSTEENKIKDESFLIQEKKRKIAIANPKTAPYGKAAYEVISKLGLITTNRTNSEKNQTTAELIIGTNVAQAMLFVATQNVDAGFIALSQLVSLPKNKKGSWWAIPQAFYEPIIQRAILLKHANNNLAAQDFMEFLTSQPAKEIITRMGYALPNTKPDQTQ